MQTQERLTSAEVSSLWTGYLNNTMSTCLTSYFLEKVEDKQVKEVVKYANDLSIKYTKETIAIFKKENFPIPKGFTTEDVNLKAKRLFTDKFIINFLKSMAKMGLSTYSLAYSLTTKSELRPILKEWIQTTIILDEKAYQVMNNKGLLERPPILPYPNEAHFVNSKMFKKGILEKKRALISQEITQLFVNTDTNLLGKNLMMAFAQVAKSHSVRKMMRKGKNIAEKHALTFTQKLQEEDLPSPSSLDLGVTDSQEAPFSDKLMLFLTAFLNAAGIGNYGLAMASSVRQDLALMYVRLTTETALFADDCADLLIKNGWMEEPPEAPDRKGLMDTKE